ncbi:transposable element Tc3 transposase [Trichonephila clavipes]|nr:transposable element Tc3 transposase [Trichonephila clavipes]
MINARTRLHVLANGIRYITTGLRYIDEVLLPHVRLFRGAVGDKFVFMDDDATCHRTLYVQNCLVSEGAGRNYPPTNKNTLIRALTEQWDKLPQQLLDNVVQRGIVLNGQTELHVFDRGSVTEDRYCKKVILSHVLLFRGTFKQDFVFRDDSARPHRTVEIQKLLESEDIYIKRWDCPVLSLI